MIVSTICKTKSGAQSGGVVTYEPVSNSNGALPKLKGIRSRVVNSKRTDLSKGVRTKVEKDNFGHFSKGLRGSTAAVYNCSVEEGRLVRAFFGHTRFATSSKASFDGTHPHQWSPRRDFNVNRFQASKATANLPFEFQLTGVEHYITHNGDFEFYKFANGKYYDTEEVQQFLVKTLHVPMPATVDSAAVAGMIDLLRSSGCFALSLRFATCFSPNVDPGDKSANYPTTDEYVAAGKVLEEALDDYVSEYKIKSLEVISASTKERVKLAAYMSKAFSSYIDFTAKTTSCLKNFVLNDEEAAGVTRTSFLRSTVDAFFDNDLLHTMRLFLTNAKGSFGLSVSSSLDAHRQVVFAAKGQTLSIAFYPRKGVICFGSEQAAVKAGLNYEVPAGKTNTSNFTPVNEDAVRLDLDDLGGEICLLDWGYKDTEPSISPPNRNLAVEKLMGGAVSVVLLHQTKAIVHKLQKRLIPLENNELIKPLLNDCKDPILADINDIPRVCSDIQKDWKEAGLNRYVRYFASRLGVAVLFNCVLMIHFDYFF